LNENELSVTELQQFDNILSVPSGERPDSENVTFRQKYQRIYGKPPGMVASYSYDGMKILIEAIRKAGIPDREKIQKALQEIHYDGVTGLIRFDDKGNRRGNFEVTNIKKGVPFAIE
jgi:branched-chain amino acid transport system substrate-binding protein